MERVPLTGDDLHRKSRRLVGRILGLHATAVRHLALGIPAAYPADRSASCCAHDRSEKPNDPSDKRARLVTALFLVFGIAVLSTDVFGQGLLPNTPRELLKLHGIDAAQLERLQDSAAIGANDEEILLRLLQRMPRISRLKLERWSQPAPDDWSEWFAASSDHRLEVFRLSGRAIQVERSHVSPEMASRLEFNEYFRVTLKLPQPGHGVALVCTRNVPQAWLGGSLLDEPATAIGLFLKFGGRTSDDPQPIFVADRVGWFPERVSQPLNVSAGKISLAQWGFDVGLLDDVRKENNKPLTLVDRECFYQLLAAIRKADRRQFIDQSQRAFEIAPILQEPERHQGELVLVEGIARRAMKVRVDDPDIKERFGLDHYYQVDVFIDLKKQVIKLGDGEPGKLPVFENSYPVTICVPSLPQELAQGETLRENVRIHAVFLKLWTYSSDFVASFDKNLLQASPLFIGVEPRVVKSEPFNFGIGYLIVAVTALSLLAILWGLRRPRSTISPNGSHASENRRDDSELPERPDFSNLQ